MPNAANPVIFDPQVYIVLILLAPFSIVYIVIRTPILKHNGKTPCTIKGLNNIKKISNEDLIDKSVSILIKK